MAPKFKSGDLSTFLESQLRYPQEAMDNNIKGTVLIAFTVNKFGEVSDPEVVSNIGGGCGEEALRLIMLSSNLWIPGVQDGQYVDVRLNHRIKFDPNVKDTVEDVDMDKVVSKAKKKERTREDRIKTLFDHGMKSFSEEKYSKARHYFKQVLQLQPDDENTMYNLALTKLKLKDSDGACNDLQKLANSGNEDAIAMMAKVCK